MKIKIKHKTIIKEPTPLINKQFFIGIALGENPTTETGVAILNRNLDLLRVDKLFTNKEILTFINNFCGTLDATVCISLATSPNQFSSKWRQDEKNIHAFSLYESSEELIWTDRFSDRGNDIYQALNTMGISAYRYNVHLSKVRLNLIPPFKMRSQPGCKYLQTVIRDSLSVNNLPNNLIPIASLEAIIGGYAAWKMTTDVENQGYIFINSFKDQKVVVPIKQNLRTKEEPAPKTQPKPKKPKSRQKSKQKKKQ
ncbi:MAG: hypothetical protein AB7V50_04645 [Vampirovibrionia bacterium]